MPSLLSTKKLSASQRKPLLNTGIDFIQFDAIQILPIDFQLPEKIENVIFTSQNAVKRIQDSKFKIQNSNCFCVGQKTKALLEKNSANIVAWAEYGNDLAHLIIEMHADKKFVFFCGNLRREEIPSLLKSNGVDFKEIITYKTELNPKSFHRTFDGIMFFSPSGVKSFCNQNQMQDSIAFCIGTTTAAEAKKYTEKIIIAKEPTVESVIKISCEVLKTL